jgi:hypothetical protein
VDIKTLHAKIGELTLENDFWTELRRIAAQKRFAPRKVEIEVELARWRLLASS